VIRREGRPPVQGYNAQAVATRQQIVIAADVTQQSNDSGQLEPMIRRAVAEIHAAGVEEPVGTVLADGGYWNNPHIVALGAEGLQVMFRPELRTGRPRGSSLRSKVPRPNGSTGC
jgi:hypothetical protein